MTVNSRGGQHAAMRGRWSAVRTAIVKSLVALSGLLIVGCGGSAPSHPSGTTGAPVSVGRQGTLYSTAGIQARLPVGWHASDRPLTAVGSPVQRLVVTSYPFHQGHPDGGCRPAKAVAHLPATGALLYMFEYEGPTHHDVASWPRRPGNFVLDPKTVGNYECMGRSYMVRFKDHARTFQAHIYLGAHATPATRRHLLSILDSLRVAAASPRAQAVWSPPYHLMHRAYLGVSCRTPNSFACDRVGLSVSLRRPALSVTATIDGRRLKLDDPRWSGRPDAAGRRKTFGAFLHPAGFFKGPLAIHTTDHTHYWAGNNPPVHADIALLIKRSATHYDRTSLVVPLQPGWG
jgi:hypothetical protein